MSSNGRTPGTEAAASIKYSRIQVTTDKNRYLSEASIGNSIRSHPFEYHRSNAYTDGLKFIFFPRRIAPLNALTTEAVSLETLDRFKDVHMFNGGHF